MVLTSRLEPGGGNVFLEVKRQTADSRASGRKIIPLSIGQPTGPALWSARRVASAKMASNKEAWSSYTDNGDGPVPGFAQRFVSAHVDSGVLADKQVGFLPVPGIKSTFAPVIQAAGPNPQEILVATMTKPGYPTPKVQAGFMGARVVELTLNAENRFLFDPGETHGCDLVFTNYPNNPTGQVADEKFWRALCEFCIESGARLFNDGAYAALRYNGSESCTLTQVAVGYSDLSWAEGFSASKLIGNVTGWRIGALVGSVDFIADIARRKGEGDSGFVPAVAAGVIHAVEHDWDSINRSRLAYQEKNGLLTTLILVNGMRIVVEPEAGFFSLWQTPRIAFGHEISSPGDFNAIMIERTGVVGVPFDGLGLGYIRYAVVADIEPMIPEIGEAFEEANVSY